LTPNGVLNFVSNLLQLTKARDENLIQYGTFPQKRKKKLSYKYFSFIEVEMQGSKIATGK